MARYWIAGAAVIALMTGAAQAQTPPPPPPPGPPIIMTAPAPTSQRATNAPATQDAAANGNTSGSEFEKGQSYTHDANVAAGQQKSAETRTTTTTVLPPVPGPVTTWSASTTTERGGH